MIGLPSSQSRASFTLAPGIVALVSRIAVQMIDLRTFTYIDVIQPQLAGFMQTVAAGYQPLENQAACFVEVAPGMSVNIVTDVALKRTAVQPGFQVVERRYGMLEFHHFDLGQVRAAGDAILDFYDLSESDRLKPKITSSEIITGVQGYHAMLINRMRHGDFLLEGQTLYIMECHPAAYAAIAFNDAQNAAPIHVLEMRAIGAFGRLYLGGYEAEIQEAAAACEMALQGMSGRPNN